MRVAPRTYRAYLLRVTRRAANLSSCGRLPTAGALPLESTLGCVAWLSLVRPTADGETESATKIVVRQHFLHLSLFLMLTDGIGAIRDDEGLPARSNSSGSFEMQIILLQSRRHSATEHEPRASARVEEGEVPSSPERRVVTWPKAQ
jgi:hypothetical protein